jgi:hypothetical protein
MSQQPMPNRALVSEFLRDRINSSQNMRLSRLGDNLFRVQFQDRSGQPAELTLKLGRLGDRRVEKEILLYRHLLVPRHTHAPRAVKTVLRGGFAWLFLESVGSHLAPLDPDHWDGCNLAFTNLARMHARHESLAEAILTQPDSLPERLWKAFADGRGGRHSKGDLEKEFQALQRFAPAILAVNPGLARQLGVNEADVEKLLATREAVIDTLLGCPPTLLHGGLHRPNILVSSDSSRTEMTLKEWGFAGLGARQLDLGGVSPDNPPEAVAKMPPTDHLFGRSAEVCLRAYWLASQRLSAHPVSWKAFLHTQQVANLFHFLVESVRVADRGAGQPGSAGPLGYLACAIGEAKKLDLF